MKQPKARHWPRDPISAIWFWRPPRPGSYPKVQKRFPLDGPIEGSPCPCSPSPTSRPFLTSLLHHSCKEVVPWGGRSPVLDSLWVISPSQKKQSTTNHTVWLATSDFRNWEPKRNNQQNTMFSCQPCGSNVGHEMNMENAIQDVKKLEKHRILHNKNCSSPDPVSLRYLQCLNHRSPASGKRLPSPQPNTTEHDQWKNWMHLPLRHCSCHQSAELVLWTWTCSDLVDVSQVFLKMLVRSNQLLIISIMLASFTWWIHTLCKRCGCSDRTCLNKQLRTFLTPCLKTTMQNNLLFPPSSSLKAWSFCFLSCL